MRDQSGPLGVRFYVGRHKATESADSIHARNMETRERLMSLVGQARVTLSKFEIARGVFQRWRLPRGMVCEILTVPDGMPYYRVIVRSRVHGSALTQRPVPYVRAVQLAEEYVTEAWQMAMDESVADGAEHGA